LHDGRLALAFGDLIRGSTACSTSRFTSQTGWSPSACPRTPFVEWSNAADPFPANATITLDDARDEPSAFLIPTDSTDDPDQRGKRWIQRNWKSVFEHLLGDWYIDPD
jgi:hypothetical protein